jgi:hypothetical protein
MGGALDAAADRLRADIAILRELMDHELDHERSDGLIIKATASVLENRLAQLRELEERPFRVGPDDPTGLNSGAAAVA